MRIAENVAGLVGGTPLVRLTRLTQGASATVAAKLEYYNPAKSVKDRISLSMVEAAESASRFGPDTILVEQAKGPFLNPLEQALPNAQVLCQKVRKASYAGLFEEVYGKGSLDCAKKVEDVYVKIAEAVAAYEEVRRSTPSAQSSTCFGIMLKMHPRM